MKRNRNNRLANRIGATAIALGLMLGGTLFVERADAGLVAAWQFNNNLNEQGGGTALNSVNFTDSYTTTTIGGDLATVLDLAALAGNQGLQVTNPIGATGLIRCAEVAKQIMGKAGDHQVPDVELALAILALTFGALLVSKCSKPEVEAADVEAEDGMIMISDEAYPLDSDEKLSF